jgi:RNA polymerase sigma-70 factor, ECF subfamily
VVLPDPTSSTCAEPAGADPPMDRIATTDPSVDLDLADIDIDTFVRAHGRALLRCAYLLVGDTRAAEDVVQAALAKVLARWDRVVAGGAPLPYVRTAVVRTALSARRRRWNGERPTASLPEGAAVDPTDGIEARQRLRQALAQVPPRQRACVVLRHYEDLDEASTAAILGCSVGTVKSQTAKGLVSLRQALGAPTTGSPATSESYSGGIR